MILSTKFAKRNLVLRSNLQKLAFQDLASGIVRVREAIWSNNCGHLHLRSLSWEIPQECEQREIEEEMERGMKRDKRR